MKIVSNTGPIIGLAKLGKLTLLKEISKEILIPPIVYRELTAKNGSESERIDEAVNDFIIVTPIKPPDAVSIMILLDLDEGERQAVTLALNVGNDVLLLLDDRAGRKAASVGIMVSILEKRINYNMLYD